MVMRWIRRITAGVTVVLVLVGPWDQVRVDATTAVGEPPPSVPNHPPQAPQRLLWSTPVSPDALYRDLVTVEGPYVAVGRHNGVAVRELLTGRRRWQYRYLGGNLIMMRAGGGRVAATFHTPQPDNGAIRLVVLDLASGRVLWERQARNKETIPHLFDGTVVMASDPVGPDGPVTFTGYRGTDGARRWQRTITCDSGKSVDMETTAAGSTVVARLTCSGGAHRSPRTKLAVVDGASGRVHWQRSLPDELKVTGAGSAVVVTAGQGTDVPGPTTRYPLTAYDTHTGRRLAMHQVESNGKQFMTVTLSRGWCTATTESLTGWEHLRCYDTRTGTQRWQWNAPLNDVQPSPNAARLAGLGIFGSFGEYPAVIFDARTGETTRVELPELYDVRELVSYGHGALVITGESSFADPRLYVYGDPGRPATR